MGERIISGVHIIPGRKFSHLAFMWRGVRHDVSVWADSVAYISALILKYGDVLDLSDEVETCTILCNISDEYHRLGRSFFEQGLHKGAEGEQR